MSNIEHVKARLSNGTLRTFDIKVSDRAPWTLEFQTLDGTLRRLQARDLFEALREMREELEIAGCQLLCAGARRDVAPLSRDMNGGRRGYVVHLGRPADMTELVDIFDYAEAAVVVTANQQRAYFQAWTKSLRQPQTNSTQCFVIPQ